MAWITGRLALLPWPALALMVLGAVLSYGARFWMERVFRGRAERLMQIKIVGLILVFAGAIWVFIG